MKQRDHNIKTTVADKPPWIARLYEVFARYPARPEMPHCEHCESAEGIRQLCEKPLHELTDDDLYTFAWHAPDTIGEVVDFKHFLPRIMEAVVVDGTTIDLPIVPGKFPRMQWRKWPAVEQEAIVEFLRGWWQQFLSDGQKPEIDMCLCAIAQVEDDLSWYLQYWREQKTPAAILQLANLLKSISFYGPDGGTISGPWWSDRRTQASQVQQWLMMPETEKSLEQAFFAAEDEDLAKRLSDAIEQYRWAKGTKL